MAEELTPYQRDILIKTILGEARGEGDTGMAAVAHNILNRANSGQYPSDPAKVALQPKQYSTWNKGEGGNNPGQFKPGSSQYERAAQIVDAVASGQIPDMTGGALQYHASNIMPYWADEANRNGQLKVGNHVFYPTHPVPPGEIPQVATLTDTRRSAPSPLSQSQNLATTRSTTSPSGGNTKLQQALQRLATVRGNEVTPANRRPELPAMGTPNVNDVYSGIFPARNSAEINATVGGLQQDPALVAALNRTAAPSISKPPISYAGQERAPISVAGPSLSQGTISYAGQDRDPSALQSALDRLATTKRNAVTPASADERVTARNRAATQPVAETASVVEAPIVSASDRARGNSAFIAQAPQPKLLGVPDQVPGPYAPPKTAERLLPSQGMEFIPNAPVRAPMQSGGLSRDAVANRLAGNTAALNRPTISPVAPFSQPIAPVQAPAVRSALMTQRPPAALANSPLSITVNGANRISPNPIFGASTGRAYIPESKVRMGGDTFTVNPNGSFTNDRTGSELRGSSSGGRSLVETPDGMQWR